VDELTAHCFHMMIRHVLYALGLATTLAGGLSYVRAYNKEARSELHRVRITYATAVVLLICAVLQSSYPSILLDLQRDRLPIAAGEWWRVVTAIFVQDGALTGTIFNLLTLTLVGYIAERIFGTTYWLLVFFSGAILSELVALAWQPVGAGNSVGTFSLAGAVCIWCLAHGRGRLSRFQTCIALAAFAALLMIRDIHGAAAAFGLLVGLAAIRK
jgi:membrane associated rhomboid family serine protease